jgi:undecaprenyl phosphate N,N'-diacetylbacillosamine 1-phosphate transferase
VGIYAGTLKRALDLVTATVVVIVILPVILLLSLVLWINNSGSPFFIQPRLGKKNTIFKVIKFKTMNDRRDAAGNLLPDELRLSRLGKWLRKMSLDELPQLFNILSGDMSFVGPRPLLTEYLPLYSAEQGRRHDVKPGITGLAQVNGRNAIDWEEKFRLDVWYVDHLSFWLDLKIIFITIYKVITSEGISGKNVATMERFTGNKKV